MILVSLLSPCIDHVKMEGAPDTGTSQLWKITPYRSLNAAISYVDGLRVPTKSQYETALQPLVHQFPRGFRKCHHKRGF